MRKLSHRDIVARQTIQREKARLPFCVVLNDIRSLYNVGSILRTADAVGSEKVWLCGITGYPPDSRIAKISLGAEDSLAWEYRKDICPLIRDLKDAGYRIVVAEQTQEGMEYTRFEPDGPICLVMGNEITGVDPAVVDIADIAIEIEMAGVKNSLNVGVAFGVMAYHIKSRIAASYFSSQV